MSNETCTVMTPPGMILNLAVVLSSAVHFDLMFSAVLGFAQ